MLEGLTPPKHNGHKCKIQSLSASMTESDKKIFFEAMGDEETWPAKTLSRSLRKLGFEVSDHPIRMHRTKQCRCYRD